MAAHTPRAAGDAVELAAAAQAAEQEANTPPRLAASQTHQPQQELQQGLQQEQQRQPMWPCVLQEQLQALHSSLQDLDATADTVVERVRAAGITSAAGAAADQQQPHAVQQHVADDAHGSSGTDDAAAGQGSSSNSDGSCATREELQQQLAALVEEKQHIEADRQDMAAQQGEYKGTIAQLEGALAFSERKVKDQLAAMEALQAQVSTLTQELQEARGAAAQTPDRCRTAAQALQAEADRAAGYARTNAAQVEKLRQIVQLEARELSELLDFAEQERQTLLEKEAALQQEVEQLRARAMAAESGACDALAETATLEQQLEATKDELLSCQERVLQLEDALAEAEAGLAAAHAHAGALAGERDAVARNLLRAEAELNDVGEYSTKMFRQVRFISHVLDKNSAVFGKLPEFATLSRDLRAFVAANARTREHGGRDGGAPGASTAAAAAAAPGTAATPAVSVSNADTTASGMRDVAGKA